MIPSLHNRGLRRRQNTFNEHDEESESLEESSLLPTTSSSTHRNNRNTSQPQPDCITRRELVLAPPRTYCINSGSGSTAISSSTSSWACIEYCSQFHPTLLRHYYDLQSHRSAMANNTTNDTNSDTNNTTNQKQQRQLPLPQLAFSEIVVGDVIGRGGFSFVHEIKDVRLRDVYDTGEDESESRREFAEEFRRLSPLEIAGASSSTSTAATNNNNNSTSASTSKQPSPYVLKTLRPDLPADEHHKGIVDLAVESQFLSALNHPHILALRASSNSDPLESRYFVILDRLISTLDKKLKQWRRDVGLHCGYWCGRCLGYTCSRGHVLHGIWMERFTAARDLACALEYLHGQNIVYRDLVSGGAVVLLDAIDVCIVFEFNVFLTYICFQ